MIFIALLQAVLHYLGLLAAFLGVIALIFGNRQRGTELIVSGLVFIAIKYLIGFIFIGAKSAKHKAKEVASEDNIYDRLIDTLNQIKHGNADLENKKKISAALINNSPLDQNTKQELLSDLKKVYPA